jgi:nucleoside-diphosphate-sugar epimerase
LKQKTLLLTGTSGFVGYKFLHFALKKNFLIIDILRKKNKKNKKLNLLKKSYPTKYKNIFFSNNTDLSNRLKNIKADCFINFATLYKNTHYHHQIPDFVNSNILFPTLIYDLVSNKTKKIINFGSMMQHSKNEKLTSKNLYSATKNAFEMIGNYYSNISKRTKFYNIKFYESFGENDTRKKLIPTIINNYKKNILTNILSKHLTLNIIHTDDIINSIMILLLNDIKPGSYCIKNTKNIKISNLINNLNKKLKKKIKVKYGNKIIKSSYHNNLKILPKWKQIKNLENEIIKTFKNETT